MSKDPANADDLAGLPNIGSVVARKLQAAGVMTPQHLKALGSVEAAFRIHALARTREDAPCASMLSGLEGAIRGVRWHAISKDEREALWKRYQARLGEDGPRGRSRTSPAT